MIDNIPLEFLYRHINRFYYVPREINGFSMIVVCLLDSIINGDTYEDNFTDIAYLLNKNQQTKFATALNSRTAAIVSIFGNDFVTSNGELLAILAHNGHI